MSNFNSMTDSECEQFGYIIQRWAQVRQKDGAVDGVIPVGLAVLSRLRDSLEHFGLVFDKKEFDGSCSIFLKTKWEMLNDGRD